MRVPKFSSLREFIRCKHSFPFLHGVERDDPRFRLWNFNRDKSFHYRSKNSVDDSHNTPDTSRIDPEPVFLL